MLPDVYGQPMRISREGEHLVVSSSGANQTRGRPLYFVGEEKNSSALDLEPGQRNVVDQSL